MFWLPLEFLLCDRKPQDCTADLAYMLFSIFMQFIQRSRTFTHELEVYMRLPCLVGPDVLGLCVYWVNTLFGISGWCTNAHILDHFYGMSSTFRTGAACFSHVDVYEIGYEQESIQLWSPVTRGFRGVDVSFLLKHILWFQLSSHGFLSHSFHPR